MKSTNCQTSLDWFCKKYFIDDYKPVQEPNENGNGRGQMTDASDLSEAELQAITKQLEQLSTPVDVNLVRQALSFISSDDRALWMNKIAFALKAAVKATLLSDEAAFELWDEWSEKSDKYNAQEMKAKWKSIKPDGRIGIGTLFYYAKQNGFVFPVMPKRNDIGLAQRFVAQHGHQVRWFSAERRWWIYDGKRWKQDQEEKALGYAKETAKQIHKEAAECNDDKERREISNFANASSNINKLKAMLEAAKPDLAITAEMLDRDNFKLNCLNGTLDLRTGKLYQHQASDYITKLVSVNYIPNAKAPRFILFLNRIFDNNQSLIDFVQQVLGYSLSGSVIEDKFFICYGSGANGKSTLFNIVCEILNEYATETDPHLLLIKTNHGGASEEVYMLRGVRIATTIETNEGVKLDLARTKKLVSQDMITARPLHGHFVQFPPTHKLFMITNSLPQIRSQSLAMWRRIVLIPFTVKIPDNEKDLKLLDKLRPEKEGILAWLVEGYLKWHKNEGLPEQTEVMAATRVYKNEEDRLENFIQEYCIVASGAQVRTSTLFAEYKDWCFRNHEPEPNNSAFINRMEEKGFVRKHTKKGDIWLGVSLLNTTAAAFDTVLEPEDYLNDL